MMHIDLTPIWHQQINLLGSTSHGMETWPPQTNQRCSTFDIAAELMAHDRIHPEQLITHHFALTDYKNALITATRKARSHAIKVVFDYSLQPAPTVPNSRAASHLSTALHPTQLAPASSHDHSKESLRQLRRSLRASEKLRSRIGNQDQPASIDMAQPTPVESKQARDDEPTSSIQTEGYSEAKEANNASSFPDLDDTPTVRVRRK
jgi:hypothetical protein